VRFRYYMSRIIEGNRRGYGSRSHLGGAGRLGWPAGTLRGRRTSSSNGSQAMVRHPAVLTALASESARISIEKFPRSTEELGVFCLLGAATCLPGLPSAWYHGYTGWSWNRTCQQANWRSLRQGVTGLWGNQLFYILGFSSEEAR
jgi:hypothetical protein